MSIRRRLSSITLALALLGGALAGSLVATADHASPRHVAGCWICPPPLEQPR